MNRRAFLTVAVAALAAGRAGAAPPPLKLHYNRYEGIEWDCDLVNGVATWTFRGKTLKTYHLTAAQQDALRKAIDTNGFFTLPASLRRETQDDSDNLTITLRGKTHTVSANNGGGAKTKPFYAVLGALQKVAPVPMDQIRKIEGID